MGQGSASSDVPKMGTLVNLKCGQATCFYVTFVNRRLETDYRRLYDELDRLIFLRVPGLDRVLEWRTLQEQQLAATAGAGRHVMDAAAIRRFVMHYERLTRQNLADLRARADLTLSLNDEDGFSTITFGESRKIALRQALKKQ